MDETAPEEVLLDGNAEARAYDFYMPSGIEVTGPLQPWGGIVRLSSAARVQLGRVSQHSFKCRS